MNPGKHGIYGFVARQPDSYGIMFPNSQTMAAPTIWEVLSKADKRVFGMNVPVTYPPRPVNGVLIGGFLSPLGFESPMFIVMPFFAFFALFFLIDWIRKGFESKLSFGMLCFAVFVIFVVCSLAAYYVALYWYISNLASLQGLEMTLEMVDFWGKLTNSAFLLFIWGGMFGIIARYVVEKINL